jgi:hypothetical protein
MQGDRAMMKTNGHAGAETLLAQPPAVNLGGDSTGGWVSIVSVTLRGCRG